MRSAEDISNELKWRTFLSSLDISQHKALSFGYSCIRIVQKVGHKRTILETKKVRMKYKVALGQQEDGGYKVYVPILPRLCLPEGNH